jgi:hypothetical protein
MDNIRRTDAYVKQSPVKEFLGMVMRRVTFCQPVSRGFAVTTQLTLFRRCFTKGQQVCQQPVSTGYTCR